jgi:lactate 2-monooxygenase
VAFASYQDEIYANGLAGKNPALPITSADLEAKAAAALPPSVWGYVAGGAGDEHTQRANCRAFWLRSLTALPLILKGIGHPDDARRAKDAGVDGIYCCSNHGGRQANNGLPALDCLPAVLEAADGLPVLFDSGIRSGADIIKALALGATAVGIGRPYAYGLALGGVDGVVHVLRCMLAEADLLMAVDGYPTRRDLTPETLRAVG